MSKNLTFKLVLDGDSKGLVAAAKQSESTVKAVFDTIKTEAQNLKVDTLVGELGKATKEITSLGDKSTISANHLRNMSMQSQQMIGALNTELVSAKAELVELSQTNATPSDIQNAVNRVADLKASIQSVEAAFGAYEAVATNAMVGVDKAASKTISEVQKFTSVDLTNIVSEAQSATRAIDSMGDGAVVSTKDVERIGDIGANSINALENELLAARSAFSALEKSSEAITLEEIKNAGDKVKGLEQAVDLTKSAFSEFNVKASSAMQSVSASTDKASTSAKQAGDDIYSALGIKPPTVINDAIADLSRKLENFKANSKLPAEEVTRVTKITEQEIARLKNELNGVEPAAEKANSGVSSLSKGMNSAKFAVNALAGAMATLGVGLGMRELAEQADSYTNLSARINIATKDGGNFTSAMAGVHQVALMTNSSLTSTADLFTRLNAVGKEMGMTQQEALNLTKTVTQAIKIGGGSAEASEAAVQQFIQAMQGGVLRGEEFNSIMEGGYGVAEALAKGLGVTTGELRKMAENGELSAERVVNALQSQSSQVQATYDQFPTTISNALQRIGTSWEILIGKMDQSNQASASVADWLVTIADNLDIVEVLLNDLGEGFVWVGDQLKKIDPATIDALKKALTTAYESIKELGATVGTAFEISSDLINNLLVDIFSFNSGIDLVTDKTNGFSKLLQVVNVALGFLGDGFGAISIVANLLTSVFYDVSAAWAQLKSKFTWGETKQQFISEMNEMALKAQEYYDKASNGALDFKSKGIAAIQEIGKTQIEKNAEATASSKAKLDQILAHQQTEVNGKKASEQEKLDAVQAYAEAAIAANKGVMDGTMQADLMTKGYIVTMDEAGKVSITAWDAAATGADKASGSADRARKAAVALGLDLDVALNRVSDKFTASQKNLNDFALGLEKLGIKGQQAADVTYQAWVKWLEIAKSQAEIDLATAKLQEFGNKGQISAKQVELGMQAIRQVVQKLPDDLNPVELAFERLGIKTKEQLKLAAQSALADFNTIQSSGQATAESLRQAYERTMQAAAASGDQAVIAATQAKAASLGLQVQIDSTGKASVKSMDDWTNANYRVRNSADGIGDGFRNAGQVARDEASSASDAWQKAVKSAESAMHATPKGSYTKLSYNEADIQEQLKAMGYDEDRAKRLAKETFQGSKSGNGYRNASTSWLISNGFDTLTPAGGMRGNSNYVQEQLERLKQYANSKAVTGAAPSVKTTTAAVETSADPKTTIRIEANGKGVDVQANSKDKDALSEILATLGTLKKST